MSFFGVWDDKDDICSSFEIEKNKLNDVEIVMAFYGCEDYFGDAFVLYKNNNKLYRVDASHCSCYGLEGQWEPEECTYKEIKHQFENGKIISIEGHLEEKILKEFLKNLLEKIDD